MQSLIAEPSAIPAVPNGLEQSFRSVPTLGQSRSSPDDAELASQNQKLLRCSRPILEVL